MRTATLYPIVIMAIITSTFSQQASAQDYSFYNNMFSNMLSNKIWDNIYAQSSPSYTEAKRKLVDPRSQAPAAPVTPDLMNRAVRFKSSGTRLMTQKFADGLSDTFKLDKAGMKEMVTSFLDRYNSEAAAKGYSNDLALALVSYIGLNSRVYRGSMGTPRYPFDQDPNCGTRSPNTLPKTGLSIK